MGGGKNKRHWKGKEGFRYKRNNKGCFSGGKEREGGGCRGYKKEDGDPPVMKGKGLE